MSGQIPKEENQVKTLWQCSREVCWSTGSKKQLNLGCITKIEYIGFDEFNVEIEQKGGVKDDFKYFGLNDL